MDIQATIREITSRKPSPPVTRGDHGGWVAPAWVVRHLVEKEGWTVSEAVREVIRVTDHDPDQNIETAFRGIRAAYYVVRKAPWESQPK